MSYGRNPHYIWSDGEVLHLDGVDVSEDLIDAFLYKILLLNRRGELRARLIKGREEWTKQMKVLHSDDDGNPETWQVVSMPHDDPEYIAHVEWMQSQEDDVIKQLMNG